MRWNWDRRAREDARRFIACGHSESDAAFWESGRRDLDHLILHDVALSREARTLEIGCGLGRLVKPLSERVAKAYGCDISVEMVERAKRAMADRDNVEVFATRGLLTPVPDASLDFVYSFIVFQHVPTKRAVARYIREAARVLAGGGVFRFQVDGRKRPGRVLPDTWVGVWYRGRELSAELAAAGFEVVGLWGERTHYLWATARRLPRPGLRDTEAVRVRRRAWRRDAVAALLSRLGRDTAGETEAVIEGRKSLRELAEDFLQKEGRLPPEDFVRRAYEVILGREADPGGLAFYSKEIASGIPPSNTVDCFLSSAELEEKLRPEVKA